MKLKTFLLFVIFMSLINSSYSFENNIFNNTQYYLEVYDFGNQSNMTYAVFNNMSYQIDLTNESNASGIFFNILNNSFIANQTNFTFLKNNSTIKNYILFNYSINSNITNLYFNNLPKELNFTKNKTFNYYKSFRKVSNKYEKNNFKKFNIEVEVPENLIFYNSTEINLKMQNRFKTKIIFNDSYGVSDINFNDLEIINDTIELGLEKIDAKLIENQIKSKIRIESKKVLTKAYAIDPEKLNFTDAIVSAIATGTELYKCENWNYTLQQCMGSVIKIKDLVPGEIYNFTLTPKDPGFFEFIGGTNDDARAVDGILEINNVLRVGNSGGSIYDSYFRFDNVSIPRNATILSAYLNLTSTSVQSTSTVNTNIYALNQLNCQDFASDDPTDNLRTTSFVAWDSISSWADLENSANTNSPDISLVVGEVASQSNWDENNPLCIVIEDDGSSVGAFREISTVGEAPARIFIEYTTGQESQIINSVGQVALVYDTVLGQDGDAGPIAITFNTHSSLGSDFNHSTPSQTSRLNILNSGLYLLSYSCGWESTGANNRLIMDNWLRINGSTNYAPSRTSCFIRQTDTGGNNIADQCTNTGTILASMGTNSYVELMGDKLHGQAGATITKSDCSLYGKKVTSPVAQYYDPVGGQSLDFFDTTINLSSITYNDSSFQLSSNGRVTFIEAGDYKINYHVCVDQITGTRNLDRHTIKTWIRENSNTNLSFGDSYLYTRTATNGDQNCNEGNLIYSFSTNDYIDLQSRVYSSEELPVEQIDTIPNQTWITIEKIIPEKSEYYVSSSSQNIATDTTNVISFDSTYLEDNLITSLSGSQITIEKDGLYEISYREGWIDNNNNRLIVCNFLRLNGATTVVPSQSCVYSRGRANADREGNSNTQVLSLNSGDIIELMTTTISGDVNILGGATWISINKIDEGVGISSTLLNPTSEVILKTNQTTYIEFNISCSGFESSTCGNLISNLEYNSSPSSFSPLNTNPSFPAWLVSNQSKQCKLNTGDYCVISWLVNLTGDVDTTVLFRANSYTDLGFTDYSENITVKILEGNILSFNQSSFNFTNSLRNNTLPIGKISIFSDLGFSENITLNCQRGDCSFFSHNFTNGINLSEFKSTKILFNCSTQNIGNFSAEFNLTSKKFIEGSLLNLSCNIGENFGTLSSALYNPSTSLSTSVVQNKTILLNGSVTCTSLNGICGNVSAYAIYYGEGSWWNSDFSYRKEVSLTYTGTKSLISYPAYLNVTYNSNMQVDYDDLRFLWGQCSALSSTQLDYEIETYNSKSAQVWVRFPNVTGGVNSICMYYGNSSVTTTESSNPVWKSNYDIVYHMDTAGIDSTSKSNNRVADVGSPTQDNSFLGYGLTFGNNIAWSMANLAYWEVAFSTRTHEIVFKTSSDVITRQALFAEGGGTNGLMMYILNGELYSRWWSESAPVWNGYAYKAAINASSIYHAVMQFNSTGNYSLYLNGNLIATNRTPDTMDSHTGDGGIAYTNTAKDFNDTSGRGYYFLGSIYEFRAYTKDEPNDWVKLNYQNMLKNNEVIGFSEEQNILVPLNISTLSSNNIIWTSSSQPKSCILNYGSTCYFNWILNLTGQVGSFIDVWINFNSNYSEVGSSITDSSNLEIVGDAQIDFDYNQLNVSSILDNGNATGYQTITALFAQNTNVSVECVSGDCLIISDLFIDGITLNRDESSAAYFTCDDSSIGNYSATFNVSSNENKVEGQLNVNCEITQGLGTLFIDFISPLAFSNSYLLQNQTLEMNLNLTCGGLLSSICGEVNAYIQYELSPGIYSNISSIPSTPLWTNELQPQICSLNYSQGCLLNWSINFTGFEESNYNISVFINSSIYGISNNRSNKVIVEIIAATPLIRMNKTIVNFGDLYFLNGNLSSKVKLISLNGNNTNVNIVCQSGDCSRFSSDWINGNDVLYQNDINMPFTCIDGVKGNFSSVYNISSNEDSSGSLITLRCSILQAYGHLSGSLVEPLELTNNSKVANQIFLINSSILCNGISNSICGEVRSYVYYNRDLSPFGSGADGNILVTNSNSILNNYTNLQNNENNLDNIITVTNSDAYGIGDEILIIQMQNGSGGGVAGLYEFREIIGKVGKQLYLDSNLENSYTTGVYNSSNASVTQIVRVPNYINLKILSSGSVTSPKWNGSVGGIVVFRVLENLTTEGYINVSNLGFRGGDCNGCGNNAWGEQGEGYLGLGGSSVSANGNGGGGGYGPSGFWGEPGGGGGYGTAGGIGASDNNPSEAGELIGVDNLDKIFFGGGGGAGGDNDDVTPFPEYIDGGGIVIIFSDLIYNAKIHAKGESGFYPGGAGGAAGSGAGGTIWIKTQNMTILDIDASGGPSVTGNGNDIGGVGGDGRIRLDYHYLTGFSIPSSYDGGSPDSGIIRGVSTFIPFFVNSSYYNSCILNTGESCNSFWYLNSSGDSFNTYSLSIFSVSNYSDSQNFNTNYTNISIRSLDRLYNVFYGSAENKLYLGQFNSILLNFGFGNQLNLFVYDSDSNIDFDSLIPIGRNKNGGLSSNDFEEIDTLLNVTNTYDRSIFDSFSLDGSNGKNLMNSSIGGKLIQNISYVNTTNSFSFITGILWDSSDDNSSNLEFDLNDSEDLVFFTKVNFSQIGYYGLYDYEILVPEMLGNYINTTSTLKFDLK